MNEIELLKQKIKKLEDFNQSLMASSSIPLQLDQAFRARFVSLGDITTSAKSASSENQAVSESGSSSYSVLKPPDAFVQVTLNATVYYIPVYT